MPKSQIIIDLVEGNVSLEQSLKRLQVLAIDLNNESLYKWINKELNGFAVKDELPEYRKVVSCTFEYSGINGRAVINQASLPLEFLKKEDIFSVKDYYCFDPISQVELYSKSDKSVIRLDRSELIGSVAVNTDNLVNCTSICQLIPQSFFIAVCNNVYSKVLQALNDMEKQYGCLDSLGIDVSKLNKKNVQDNNIKINNTVFNIDEKTTKEDNRLFKIISHVLVPIGCVILGFVLDNFYEFFI